MNLGPRSTPTSENKIAVALAARAAMKEHRKGKPVAFQSQRYPRV